MLMEKVNIIYDDEMDDVDIIAIPKEMCREIENLVQSYMEWLMESAPKDDEDYWITINGKRFSNLETVGFVKWLNNYYCNNSGKVSIIEQHTSSQTHHLVPHRVHQRRTAPLWSGPPRQRRPRFRRRHYADAGCRRR